MKNLFKLVGFLARTSEGKGFSRGVIALSMLGGLVAGAANAGFIAVINSALTAGSSERVRLLWIFAGLCLVLPTARFLSSYLLTRLVQAARVEIETQLSRKILSAPLRTLESAGSSRLLAALTEDVATIVTALGNVPVMLRLGAVVVGCLAYLAWLSTALFLVVCGALVLGAASYQLPKRAGRRHFRFSRELSDRLFRHFRGLTEGIKELKIHRPRRVAFAEEHLDRTARKRAHHRVAARTIFFLAESWSQLIAFLVLGLLVFFAPRLGRFESEVLTGYVLAFLYMLNPLEGLLNRLPILHQANVSVAKIRDLGLMLEEAREPELPEIAGCSGDGPAWDRLELVGVTHQYYNERDERSFTLGPVDLTLERGDCLFLVGGNGSGKTTLAKLLAGLYASEEGELRLDGETVPENELERVRRLFSAVFSDFYLFEDLMGISSGALADNAREYLMELQLEQKVSIEDGALSTIRLSQGQRKRLALLVAYLEDRPIYLFDEWAADQDPTFKEIFYLKLVPDLLRRGKTVVVITHDDKYFHVADRIVKLDSGRLELETRETADGGRSLGSMSL